MTRKATRKTRSSTVPAASVAVPPAGAIAQILEDLDFATALCSTAHSALSAGDVDADAAQTTLGHALERLRAGMERVRAMRSTQD
jgi:hypothetical protein